MPPGMVGAEKNGVGCGAAGTAVPMEREDVRRRWRLYQWGVRMQNIGRSGYELSNINPPRPDLAWIHSYERGFWNLRAVRRKQCDPMAQLSQASSQPHDHSLCAAIARHGKSAMKVEGHMHAQMYRLPFQPVHGASRQPA